jgi:hypothetical protein
MFPETKKIIPDPQHCNFRDCFKNSINQSTKASTEHESRNMYILIFVCGYGSVGCEEVLPGCEELCEHRHIVQDVGKQAPLLAVVVQSCTTQIQYKFHSQHVMQRSIAIRGKTLNKDYRYQSVKNWGYNL